MGMVCIQKMQTCIFLLYQSFCHLYINVLCYVMFRTLLSFLVFVLKATARFVPKEYRPSSGFLLTHDVPNDSDLAIPCIDISRSFRYSRITYSVSSHCLWVSWRNIVEFFRLWLVLCNLHQLQHFSRLILRTITLS